MSRVQLFGLGQTSKSPFVTAKALQNMYAEQRPVGEKSAMVAYGTPGLDLFASFGATPPRGGLEFPKNDVAYVVHRGTLWEINNAAVMTNRGSLATTSGRVSMAHNGVQVMIVDGTSAYIYDTGTLAFSMVVSSLFANPTTVCYLSRRFLVSFTGSGRYQWSDIDDGLTFGALNFSNAESNPDPLTAIYSSNGQAIMLGTESTEFAGNSGIADPAFVALQGNATEWGLAARWSIAKYDNSFACLMKNRMGQVMIAQMAGYLPKKLSTVDLDAIINDKSVYASTADATAYSYMLGGHPMYVITFPSAGYSWLFDGSTGIWSPLKSLGITRHLAEFSFNLVGRTIVADYANGNLYVLNPLALTDNGASIERSITGETVASQDIDPLTVDCFRVDMEVGVGLASGQGVNPLAGLEVSRDNGKTWGPQMWKTMGAVGDYAARVEWRRLGTNYNFTPRITITDPVRCVIVSACINPNDD